MPANIVNDKDPREARLWNQAKEIAKKAGKEDQHDYTVGIFERMRDRVGGGKPLKDQAAEAHAHSKKGGITSGLKSGLTRNR